MPITMLPLALSLFAAPLVPDTARAVPPGTRIRLEWTGAKDPPRRGFTEGKVVANEEAAITVEEDGVDRTKVRVPWATVRSMQVQKARTPAGARLAKGVGLGVAIGAASGALLAEVTDHGCQPGAWCLFSHGQTVEMAAGGLGIAGGLLGGLFGLAGGHHWSRVAVPEDRVTVVPEISRRGAGLRVALRF